MEAALRNAAMSPGEIGYVNAHGTSTPMGDEIEVGAVERLFGAAADGLIMSSTKSAVGHLLGAAGAAEAIFATLVLRDDVIPPTLNLDNPSIETPIDLTPHEARKARVNAVLSNSFGFGGTNASLIIRRVD
jgi:3-oxoacyl-[acyl-carrier-protein] synthase II